MKTRTVIIALVTLVFALTCGEKGYSLTALEIIENPKAVRDSQIGTRYYRNAALDPHNAVAFVGEPHSENRSWRSVAGERRGNRFR